MNKKIIIGDIFLVNTEKVHITLQYVGDHREYGECIAIYYDYNIRERDRIELENKKYYFTFYPLKKAARIGLIKKIGNSLAPTMPGLLRRPGMRSNNHVDYWVLEDGTQERNVKELSINERELPIAAIWNHEYLIQKLKEGWTPRAEY